MNRTTCKLIALLVLFQVMNSQPTLDLATGATATIMSTDDDAFRYIIKKQISASSF